MMMMCNSAGGGGTAVSEPEGAGGWVWSACMASEKGESAYRESE